LIARTFHTFDYPRVTAAPGAGLKVTEPRSSRNQLCHYDGSQCGKMLNTTTLRSFQARGAFAYPKLFT
jgi:hypothetical protein